MTLKSCRGTCALHLPEGVQIENVYAFNLMNSILQQKTEPAVLAHKTIPEFLAGLDINDNGYYFDATRTSGVNQELHWRRVLIIDQFEEIFTTQLDAWLKHGDFFRQVAQALQDDPYLTVILIMRDDYIASLDLYAHLLPGGLRTRYYMQRLTREAALKAVKNPVENIRPFAEGIAEKLVEDLSGILVHKAGGFLKRKVRAVCRAGAIAGCLFFALAESTAQRHPDHRQRPA